MIRQQNSQVANSFENYQTVGKNVPRGSRASLQRRHYLRPSSFSAARINAFAAFRGLLPGVRIKMLMGSDLSAARRGRQEVFPCLGALALGFKCRFQSGAATPDGLQAGEGAWESHSPSAYRAPPAHTTTPYHHPVPPPHTTTPHHRPVPPPRATTPHHHPAPLPCTTTLHHHPTPPPHTTTLYHHPHHHPASSPCITAPHHHPTPPPRTTTPYHHPTAPSHPTAVPLPAPCFVRRAVGTAVISSRSLFLSTRQILMGGGEATMTHPLEMGKISDGGSLPATEAGANVIRLVPANNSCSEPIVDRSSHFICFY